MAARRSLTHAAGLLLATGLLLGLPPNEARAQPQPSPAEPEPVFTWLPGPAREIVRTRSASRDTPVLEAAWGPRAQSNLGVDYGLVRLRIPSHELSLRWSGYAMIALEQAEPASEGEGQLASYFFPIGSQLWRGLYGTALSLSADGMARRWLGAGGGLEVTVLAGHESDHFDHFFRAFEPSDEFATRPGDITHGGGGNFIQPDLALRVRPGDELELTMRVQDRIYFEGPLLHAPGLDAVLRYRLLDWLEPTLALFGEALLADPRINQADHGGSGRLTLGPAFVGRWGEITTFFSTEVGNGKGMLINHRELRFGAGIRYAIF